MNAVEADESRVSAINVRDVALQRKTAASAALLLVIGFATGGLLAAAMTGKLSADSHEVLAAHLNGVLGCFWLAALSFTLPLVSFTATGKTRLVVVTVVASYGNWLITTIKSFFHVAGVGLNGEVHNDAVFAALNVVVVIPSFVAAIAWTYGLYSTKRVPKNET